MNVLFDLYFLPWFNKQLSQPQRDKLTKSRYAKNFRHAMRVCRSEKDTSEFYFWLNEAKQEAAKFFSK